MPSEARCDSSEERSTEDLVELARSGDDEAFGELMNRHRSTVRRTATAILKNWEDAEDVVQEVSLSVLRKLHTFEGNAKFSTWLTRIAVNASLQRLRRARSRPSSSLEELTGGDDAAFVLIAASGLNPEQEYSSRQMRKNLGKAVSLLPIRLREVAQDYIYEELSLVEVADKRGLSLPAVKSRTYRARKKLMTMLDGQCVQRSM
ncbi:RNA polymerase sigma factor [Terriglobus roseus]|uniref:RNA polymerase sigma-70 factor, ECF subfamily n=1 Tax=Terriglobus roseus TaxID=392734 RepID=A0A1H4JA35_9BACT|nr:sigma-70 family RNA polymerase sigma factor [Terriglobus roseus]SEB43017.1 RNA polymerase sigma-70 factor, ECF subfamily [Terriglobus roseus]